MESTKQVPGWQDRGCCGLHVFPSNCMAASPMAGPHGLDGASPIDGASPTASTTATSPDKDAQFPVDPSLPGHPRLDGDDWVPGERVLPSDSTSGRDSSAPSSHEMPRRPSGGEGAAVAAAEAAAKHAVLVKHQPPDLEAAAEEAAAVSVAQGQATQIEEKELADEFLQEEEEEQQHGPEEPDKCEKQHGHGHHESPKSMQTALASGLINFLLMFGLCSAYGMIMFEADCNQQHRALGVKMNLCTAGIVGIMLSATSRIKVAVGGPDLNPVVFLGGFVSTIADSIADQLDLTYPDTENEKKPSGGWSYAEKKWCTDDYLSKYADSLTELELRNCPVFHKELRATVIFTTAASSAIFAIIFFGLGRLRLTRLVSHIPTSIMEAFLSCIGYKVFMYALKFAKFKPVQFLPAAFIGVVLYFLKALHIGNPAVVIPLGLLIPLGIFYIIIVSLAKTDDPIQEFRDKGYFFPEMEDEGNEFYRIWTDSLGELDSVNYKAWLKTLPDLIIMIIVVLMDCVLKLANTEAKLPVKPAKDFEMQLYGLSNVLTTLCGSSVGYMQLKFNVIAYGIMGNVEDRRGGFIYAALCLVCFFGGIALINYLPRFFLSTLLFFAGAGFIAENLWGSRKYLSLMEWAEILSIIGVFALSGSLLYAVCVGAVITGLKFIYRFSKIPVIAGLPLTGKDVLTSFRRHPVVQKNLQHIADSWLLVIRLKGYIFCGSAQSMMNYVRVRFEQDKGLPLHRRLRFLIFDCELLDGMDASTEKAMRQMRKEASEHGVEIIWCDLDRSFVSHFKQCEVLLDDRNWFLNLDDSLCHIEEQIMAFLRKQQARWLSLHPTFQKNHRELKAKWDFEPFNEVFLIHAARMGCPWKYCTRMQISQFRSFLWHDEEKCDLLFLVHSGAVGLFERPGSSSKGRQSWGSPIATYRHGWFLNREALTRAPSKHFAVALEDGELLVWTAEQRRAMTKEHPHMMVELQKEILKQQSRDSLETSKSAEAPAVHLHGTEYRDLEEFVDDDEDLDGERSPHTIGQPGVRERKSGGEKLAEPKRRARQHLLPQELHGQLTRYKAARGIKNLGSYEPSEHGERSTSSKDPGKLPDLPRQMVADLEIAFATFAVQHSPGGSPVLPPDKVIDALRYAGAFQVPRAPPKHPVGQADFIELAHRHFMMPLGKDQMDKVHELFGLYDKSGLGALNQHQLFQALHHVMQGGISEDEVDMIATAWSNSITDCLIDVKAFTEIISMYVRKFESQWNMLVAMEEVLRSGDGSNTSSQRLRLTADVIAQRFGPRISSEQAEEMVWAVDWFGHGANRGVNLRSLCAILSLQLQKPSGKLPPPPQRMLRIRSSKKDQGDKSLGLSQATKTAASQNLDECAEEENGMVLFEELQVLSNDLQEKTQFYLDKASGSHTDVSGSVSGEQDLPPTATALWHTWQGQLHLLLEVPSSSSWAQAFNTYTFAMIICSVLTVFVEPLASGEKDDQSNTEKGIWFGIEVYFTVIFTAELLLRFLVCDALGHQTKCDFMRAPSNILDFVAILPFYIEVALQGVWQSLRLLRLFRIIRISRFMRLARLARLAKLAPRIDFAAPVAVVLVVIWGIYLKYYEDYA